MLSVSGNPLDFRAALIFAQTLCAIKTYQMKNLITIIVICLFVSCGKSEDQVSADRYIVETTVQLKKGVTDEVLELFKSTNPELVRNESDWITASFSSISDEDLVIVRAEWKSKEAYLKFSSSDKFKKTMSEFSKYFEGKPRVTIAKVLFEM